MGEKVQGIRSIIGRYKVDRRRYRKWRSQTTYKTTHGQELRGEGILVGEEEQGRGGTKGEKLGKL